MKVTSRIAVLAAFAALAVPSTTLAAECVKMERLSVATLDIGTRYPQIAIGIAGGYFKRHCLDLTVVPFQTPLDVSKEVADRKVDGSVTIEPLVESYLQENGSELMGIYAVMTNEINVIVATVPIRDFVGEVIAGSRCPKVPERAGGKIWGDVTDPESEGYGKKPPSLITRETLETIRAAIKDGALPGDTRIICGRDFTNGFRPDIGGHPAVYLEEGQNALRRIDMLIEGSVVATILNLEQLPGLRQRLPGVQVYPSAIERKDLWAAGIFAYPSMYEQKPAAFCSLKKALQEINTDLLAGKIADKPFTELTPQDLDKKAETAYGLFEQAVAFDGLPNRFPGTLTLKNMNDVGVDEAATLSARLETFAESRRSLLRPDLAVGPEEFQRFRKVFRIKEGVGSYQDPCK